MLSSACPSSPHRAECRDLPIKLRGTGVTRIERVEGQRDGVVTEEFLNHLGVDAPIKQVRGRGVPQIMKPEP
jgi:hypothetical protein